MKDNNFEKTGVELPAFATSAAAASYRVGKEAFIDLVFLRAHFVIDDLSAATPIEGQDEIQQQSAEMRFANVSSVTMTAEQARVLVEAIQHQLQTLAKE